jgi:hypothetical protein
VAAQAVRLAPVLRAMRVMAAHTRAVHARVEATQAAVTKLQALLDRLKGVEDIPLMEENGSSNPSKLSRTSRQSPSRQVAAWTEDERRELCESTGDASNRI